MPTTTILPPHRPAAPASPLPLDPQNRSKFVSSRRSTSCKMVGNDIPDVNPHEPRSYGVVSAVGLLLLILSVFLGGCDQEAGATDEVSAVGAESGAHSVETAREGEPIALVHVPQHADELRHEMETSVGVEAFEVRADLGGVALPGPSARLAERVDRRLVGNGWGGGVLLVSVVDVEVQRELVGTQELSRLVPMERLVANPAIAEMERRLAWARREVKGAKGKAKEHWDAYHWLQKEYKETGDKHWQRMLPTYRKQAERSQRRLDHAKSRADGIREELSCLPVHVGVTEYERVAHVEETHEQVGTMVSLITRLDERGRVLWSRGIEARHVETATRDAAGGLGVEPGALIFTRRAVVIDRLLEDSAARIEDELKRSYETGGSSGSGRW